MSPLWSHAECLPIVRDKILSLCRKKSHWVLIDDVIPALLEDPTISREASRASAGKKQKEPNIVANMIGFLNERITQYEKGTIPKSWFDFAQEIHSLIERKEIKGRWAYKLRHSHARLQPKHWIFVGKDKDDGSAVEIFEEDMRRHYWGIKESAKNTVNLSIGDKVVFYLGDSGERRFFGTATLRSRYLNTKKARQRGHDFSGVELVHIDLWNQPKPVDPLFLKLHFVKNKQHYGTYFQGSVHQIPAKDYATIAGKRNEQIFRQKAELANESRKQEPSLTEPSNIRKTMIKIRSAEFGRAVKENYDYSCAVCGRSRFTKDENPEVESAHIYPVAKNGSNDFRNGIALCRLHHWAFENGLFSIKDNYSIIVEKRTKEDDNYKEISFFENKKIRLPEEYLPHPKFLKEHRKIHDFE